MPSLPPWATGPWVLLPYPGLVPLGGAPTVEIKVGDGMGEEEGQESPHPLLPWGQGLTPLEGQRQEVEAPRGTGEQILQIRDYKTQSGPAQDPEKDMTLMVVVDC